MKRGRGQKARRQGRFLRRYGRAGTRAVGDGNGDGSSGGVRRSLHVYLSAADVMNKGRLAVDGDAGTVETGGRVRALEILALPQTRSGGEIGPFDLEPGSGIEGPETAEVREAADGGDHRSAERAGSAAAAGRREVELLAQTCAGDGRGDDDGPARAEFGSDRGGSGLIGLR